MNPRLNMFLMIVAIVIILFVAPVFLSNIESVGLNFFIRSLLVIFVIYLILETIKYIKK